LRRGKIRRAPTSTSTNQGTGGNNNAPIKGFKVAKSCMADL
jgi:hypothetical protein